MKKILLTGVNGQVGHALNLILSERYDLVALNRSSLDLTDNIQILECVKSVKPDIIINPAAYTAVDKAESESNLAFKINAEAPKAFAMAALEIKASLIHFSTDYVFDGEKTHPYKESDQVNPLSIYGESKLEGERNIQQFDIPHLILRTSWVYGSYGKNFFNTILRLAKEKDALKIVSDQIGSPTSATSIANGVVGLLEKWRQTPEENGIYHFTNQGHCSWYDFACEIIEQYQVFQIKYDLPALQLTSTKAISPITTLDFPTPAVRPKNSRINNQKLLEVFGIELADWKEGLSQVFHEYILQENIKIKQ
jgi:dTDP-4-dehydrorhamnose reductase